MNQRPIAARPYLRDEVYAALKLLLSARAVGIDVPVRVREEELAAELGVSRTPVREAMRRLEQEGLVSFQPRRGARLMPTSLPEYLEWLSIREVLEGLAAREVAANGAADVADPGGLLPDRYSRRRSAAAARGDGAYLPSQRGAAA